MPDIPLTEMPWIFIRMLIMTTLAQILLFALVLVVVYKMNRLVAKLDQISEDAGKFLHMGMTYFKKK